MSTAQRVIKNTIWLYVRMAASIFVNVFTTRILLQALGASDYGLYNVVGGAIAMLGFLSSSMSTATQRFISYAQGQGSQDRVKEIFNNAQIVHYGLAVITVVLLTAAAFIFFNGVLNIPPGREMVARGVYACVVFSTVFSITIVPYDATLNAHENMRFYSIAGIFDVIFKFLIAIIVLYVDGERLLLYAILMVLESWLLRLITKYYCTRHYEECRRPELRKYFSRDTVRQMTSFAGWNLANIATLMLSLFGMTLVVNHFFGTEINAALGVATQLSGVLMAVSMNMIKAITPVLVKKEGGRQREQMLQITYVSCKFSYLLFSFFCIPVIFFIQPILDLWLHDVPAWTDVFCQLLLISTLVDQVTIFLFQSLQAEGHIKQYSLVKSFINILPIIISILMFALYDFEPYWALVNHMVGKGVLGGMLNLHYARKNIGLSIKAFMARVITPCSFITLFSILLGIFLLYVPWNWICALISFFVVSSTAYWFVGLNKEEKSVVMQLIKRKSL